MDPQNQTVSSFSKRKSIGSFFVITITIAILIVGALYAWGKKLNEEAGVQNSEEKMI